MHRFGDNTGWQSWSVTSINFPIKFPRNRFPPKDYIATNFSECERTSSKDPATGWCSWPHFGHNVSEKIIMEQLEWLSGNLADKLKYILLDDGWTAWGDWLDPTSKKFPSGLSGLSKKIKNAGFSPGIWIAPFLVNPKSKLAKERPDWLVQENGKFVNGMKALDREFLSPMKRYLLDVTNASVLEYLESVFAKLFNDHGFKLVKLDFLYANHFNPKLSGEKADIFLRNFFEDVKEKYPDVYTIACGCPLKPAAGVVDSCRIAPDNSVFPLVPRKLRFLNALVSYFYSRFYMRVLSANYKKREWTKDFWNLDLDAYICDKRHGFSKKQLSALRDKIIESEGNVFLGDDLTSLSQEQIKSYIEPLF